jgi:hypothetical protein
VRVLQAVIVVAACLLPGAAAAQVWEVSGSAGPTIVEAGHSVAVGAGLWPASRVSIVFTAERTHIAGGTRRTGNLISSVRGGTIYVGTAELRVTPLGRDRVGPFVVAGVAAGTARPNVNATFPTRVTNDVRAIVLGGGLQVPLRKHLAITADTRFIYGEAGIGGIVAVVPLRAGLTWRF